ncbi:MAG: hypothetical protein AAB853_04725, partial [Patescibacteria group bacterium]
MIDKGEQCDGTNFGPLDGNCASYDIISFTGGKLSCTNKCEISTASCLGLSGTCGNSRIDIGEECDGNVFGTIDECNDYSTFIGGTVRCNRCQLDTSQCTPVSKCGNGVVNIGESCDGSNFGGKSSNCAQYSPFFKSGTLTCTNKCQLDTSSCILSPTCGNGFIDENEQCDKTNFGNINKACTSYSSTFQSGTLSCNDNCEISTANCIEKPTCSNDIINTDETCDGTNFGSITDLSCNSYSQAFGEGTLACKACQISTENCKLKPICGDSQINQPGELCDTNKFGEISNCLQYTNFIGGLLKCSNECKLDVSECTRVPTCGNNYIDPEEACDGALFGQIKTCADYSQSFTSGTLKCTPACQLDTSSCIEKPKCGNSIIDSGEECDGSSLGALNGQCTQYGSLFTGGTLRCNNNCKLDTSQCFGVTGTCANNIININEKCDGANFGAISSCSDLGFEGGEISCKTCNLDTSKCTSKPPCGNSIINKGESCDTANLGSLSGNCLDYGSAYFKAGALSCTDNCRLDTSNCVTQLCGNNKLDTGELCDGTNFGSRTDLSCNGYDENFVSGTLTCKDCGISTENCVPKKCGDGVINQAGEQCDGTNFGSRTDLSCSNYGTNFASGT